MKDSCRNCKKYKLNGGSCTGVRSRHCKKYKPVIYNLTDYKEGGGSSGRAKVYTASFRRWIKMN